MKIALITIEDKHIVDIYDEVQPFELEGMEQVEITNARAITAQENPGSFFLIDGKLVNFREKFFLEDPSSLKNSKRREIKLARNKAYQSNMISSDGFEFKADLETVFDIKTIIEILPDGGSFPDYKCADGSYNTISKVQFQTAITEGVQRKLTAFAREKQLNEEVDNAISLEVLDAIAW
tara:strand:- start:1166 stop:1702 length:537 start_codon:yes stop_codon:yes gene_type:complete